MTAVNVCFVGVGSIATRHIVNLHAIFKARGRQVNIDCCRSGMHALPQELNGLIRNVFYAPEEVGDGYDMIFITNPTHMHLDAIRAFKDKSDCFFVEKPLCAPGQDVSVIGDVAQNPAKKVYIACPLRYTNVIRYIKNNIDLSKVYAVRCICSSYLPDWRAGSDYRNTYSAHKDMGGASPLT
jgi:predicted dehydrogenase